MEEVAAAERNDAEALERIRARRGATTTRSATPWPRTCARSWRGRRRRRRSIIQMTSRRCPRQRRSACARRSSLRRCRPRRPSRRPSSGPAPRRRPTRRPNAGAVGTRAGRRRRPRRDATPRRARSAARRRRRAAPRRRGGGGARRSSRALPLDRFAPRPFFCLRRPRCPHLHVGPDARAVDATARSTQVRPRGRPARGGRLPRRGGGAARRARRGRLRKTAGGAARPQRAVRRRARRCACTTGAASCSPCRERERCRDRFLDLLRDYEAARRDANRERLSRRRTTPSWVRNGRPQRARRRGKQETDRRPRVPGLPGRAARARRLVRARFHGYPHGRVGPRMSCGRPASTRSGRARLWKRCRASSGSSRSSSSAPTRRPSPILYGRCSSRRREDVDAGRAPGRASARRWRSGRPARRCVGFLRSAPNFSSSSQPGGGGRRTLDVVRVLQSVKDASDARAYFVAAWVCAFLAALQCDAASRKEDTAIMDEEALRARAAPAATRRPLCSRRASTSRLPAAARRPLASLALAAPAPAPTSPASARDAWSPRRAPNVADADARGSPAARGPRGPGSPPRFLWCRPPRPRRPRRK